MHKAVFLDRDGTIARDVPYCNRPEDFELLPDAAEGIKLLVELARRAGCKAGIRVGEARGTGDLGAASFTHAVRKILRFERRLQ